MSSVLYRSPAAGDEVQNYRDDSKNNEQMDKEAAHMHDEKPTKPKNQENYCEDEKH
jgi:hypothetical protein